MFHRSKAKKALAIVNRAELLRLQDQADQEQLARDDVWSKLTTHRQEYIADLIKRGLAGDEAAIDEFKIMPEWYTATGEPYQAGYERLRALESMLAEFRKTRQELWTAIGAQQAPDPTPGILIDYYSRYHNMLNACPELKNFPDPQIDESRIDSDLRETLQADVNKLYGQATQSYTTPEARRDAFEELRSFEYSSTHLNREITLDYARVVACNIAFPILDQFGRRMRLDEIGLVQLGVMAASAIVDKDPALAKIILAHIAKRNHFTEMNSFFRNLSEIVMTHNREYGL